MRRIIFLLAFVLAGQLLMAQPKPTDVDKSPMDISYYPENYPILKMRGQANGEPLARIIYSRPQLKGRGIFGQEVKYNQVWRLGANEATELELFKNATIGGNVFLKAVMSCIVFPQKQSGQLL